MSSVVPADWTASSAAVSFLPADRAGPYFQAWYCCLQDGAAACVAAAATDASGAADVAGWGPLHAAAAAMTNSPTAGRSADFGMLVGRERRRRGLA